MWPKWRRVFDGKGSRPSGLPQASIGRLCGNGCLCRLSCRCHANEILDRMKKGQGRGPQEQKVRSIAAWSVPVLSRSKLLSTQRIFCEFRPRSIDLHPTEAGVRNGIAAPPFGISPAKSSVDWALVGGGASRPWSVPIARLGNCESARETGNPEDSSLALVASQREESGFVLSGEGEGAWSRPGPERCRAILP